MIGGSLKEGKTSNQELDEIFRRYLPKQLVVPCHTFPTLTRGKVEALTALVRQYKLLLVPIFIRHHWIAGLLTWSRKSGVILTIYDSAPSPIVHKDLYKVVRDLWPELKVRFGESPRQERGSDDCGLYMSVVFFATHFEKSVTMRTDTTKRLRTLYNDALQTALPPEDFIPQLQALLWGTEGARAPPKTGSEGHYAGGANHEATPATTVSEVVRKTLHDAKSVEKAMAQRQLCYFLVATSLVNVGDGRNRSLAFNPLCSQVHRKGFKGSTQYDVADALATYHAPVDLLTYEGDSETPRLLPRSSRRKEDAIYVQGPVGTTLPHSIEGWTFRIGARFEGEVGANGAYTGHFSLTDDPSKAVYGVYHPEGQDTYPVKGARPKHQPKQAGPPPRVDRAPLSASPKQITTRTAESSSQPEQRPQAEDSEMEAARNNPPVYLNSPGNHCKGEVESPRCWYIYQDKPPGVSRLAWSAITKEMRGLHRRWLQDLRAMPDDLLDKDLPQAALELVRRMATARNWKWSTWAKSLAAISGALANLPLYTNQGSPVDVTQSPEWRAAAAAAHRFERECVPEPPEPIRIDQYLAARRSLATTSPVASLYLGMMWSFAARAGDISNLQARDVTFSAQKEDGSYPVSLTVRRGKAAKMRGPYPLGTLMTAEDASLLHSLVVEKTNRGRLFPDNAVRELVRAALKAVSPGSALPSVRKGALRHITEMGVPEDQIMRLSGHTRADTLRRYLGYGLHLTWEAVVAQANAGEALQRQSS